MEENGRIVKAQKIVLGIIDQFSKEELGNRLSQFACISLRGMIKEEFDKLLKPVEEELKQPDEGGKIENRRLH